MNELTDILLSEKFYEKLLGAMFKQVDDSSWYKRLISYCIDSKYRRFKELHTFLEEQVTYHSTHLTPLRQDALAIKNRCFSPDEIIVEILKFVHDRIVYKSDTDNFGASEYWADTIETFEKGADDCDGINGAIYVMARLAGIPRFVLYCAIGDVAGGGHFWCLYYTTSHDKLVPIDGTYFYTSKSVKLREPFKFTENKYKNIWYLFNDRFSWKQT